MAAIGGIGFKPLTPEDEAGIRDVIYDAGPRVPLCMGLGFKSPYDFKVPMDITLPEILGNGLSYCSYDTKTGAIVGIRMCTVAKKGDLDLRREHATFDINAPETKKIAQLELVEKSLRDGLDIFEMYQTDKFVHFFGFFVKESYGRRGIGRRLIEETLRHVQRKGYGHIWAEASGGYSLSVFRKMDFEEVAEKVFDDVYEGGEKVIKHSTDGHKKDCVVCEGTRTAFLNILQSRT